MQIGLEKNKAKIHFLKCKSNLKVDIVHDFEKYMPQFAVIYRN